MLPNRTLLVVDDEASILDAYRHYLASDLDERLIRSSRLEPEAKVATVRYDLLLAQTGEQAIALVDAARAQGRRVAGGFFDMKLPGGMDGMETIRRVRAIDPDVLCCVVTAFQDSPIDELHHIFAGGHEDEWDYINKPFTASEIRQKARGLVSSWARRREQEEQRRDLERLIDMVREIKVMPAGTPAGETAAVAERLRELGGAEEAFLVRVGPRIELDEASARDARSVSWRRSIAVAEIEALLRRVAATHVAEATDTLSAFLVAGGAVPTVAVVLHARPPRVEKRRLLRILADSAVATLDNRRLYEELRGMNATLEQRVSEQVADIRHANQALFEAARTDPLTDTGNRLRLREDLDALVGRAKRYGHQYVAALCDVDHFKLYNDRYGHLAGDDVLRRVVETMRKILRSGDAVYRWGGEEFLIILPEQDAASGLIALERVRRAIEELNIEHDSSPLGRITISAGYASMPPPSQGMADQWILRADEALYRAKRTGRNRCICWDGAHAAAMPAPSPLVTRTA